MPNGEDMFGGPSAAELGSDYRRLQQQYGEAAQSNQERFLAAMERMRAERIGPTTAEKLFAISSALSRPTRTGKITEEFGNVGRALGAQEAEKRKAQMERAAMLEKYGMGQGAATLEALKAQLDSAGQMYRAATAAEAAAKRPRYMALPPGGSIMNLNALPEEGYTPPPQKAVAMPRIGDVLEGYEYIGGSPDQEKSWRKVR
jgi:hypothetical protein